MNIELIGKNTYWYGSKGAVLSIRARLTTDTGRRVVDIYIEGISEPFTTMNVISITSDSYFTIPTAAIHEWLQVKGYMRDWEQEASKYRAALAKVYLPYQPRDVKESYLSYRLSVGDMRLMLGVQDSSSYLDVYVDGDEDDGDFIGAYTLKGEINMTTVRAALNSVVSTYIGKLRTMIDLPIEKAP